MRWLLIDRIISCEPGVSAVGLKTFPRSDLFFTDHFPGFPIVPGVLQIEMIAQMAGKCYAMSREDILPVLGSVKSAKFYHNIQPGDACFIKAKVEKAGKNYILASGEIEVEGRKMSSASILFGLVDRAKTSSNNFDEVTADWLRRQKENKDAKNE